MTAPATEIVLTDLPGPLVLLRGLRGGSADTCRAADVPGLAATVEAGTIDAKTVVRYAAAFGIDPATIPLAYDYVWTQRLQLALLTDPRFPLRAAGVVHVANRIQRFGELPSGRPLRLRAELREIHDSERGLEFTVRVTVGQGDTPVSQIDSDYLARRSRTTAAKQAPRAHDTSALPVVKSFEFGADAGRAYARLSGDYNPIHLWPLTSRMFGYDRPILHGMCLGGHVAAYTGTSGQAMQSIQFRSPVRLPGKVQLHASERDGQIAFELRGPDGRLHAEGTARP